MPAWLRDRRDVVLERLPSGTGGLLQEVDAGYDDVSGRLLDGPWQQDAAEAGHREISPRRPAS